MRKYFDMKTLRTVIYSLTLKQTSLTLKRKKYGKIKQKSEIGIKKDE